MLGKGSLQLTLPALTPSLREARTGLTEEKPWKNTAYWLACLAYSELAFLHVLGPTGLVPPKSGLNPPLSVKAALTDMANASMICVLT